MLSSSSPGFESAVDFQQTRDHFPEFAISEIFALAAHDGSTKRSNSQS